MGVCGVIDQWGSTAEERLRHYPCDDVLAEHEQSLFRAVNVEATPSVVFRWLCELKVAPYSYDLIDNVGLRSPQHFVPGVDRLVLGEQVVIFELASFAADEHITIALRQHRVFGDLVMMRRQLLILKSLAEATATEPVEARR